MTNKVDRKTIETLQVILDRMNVGIDLENEIETWNHCCANADELIEVQEEN